MDMGVVSIILEINYHRSDYGSQKVGGKSEVYGLNVFYFSEINKTMYVPLMSASQYGNKTQFTGPDIGVRRIQA